jgi:hypothetical protein
MDAIDIHDYITLRLWAENRDQAWIKIVASRAALRAMVGIEEADDHWLRGYGLLLFRANFFSWAAGNDKYYSCESAAKAAVNATVTAEPFFADAPNEAFFGNFSDTLKNHLLSKGQKRDVRSIGRWSLIAAADALKRGGSRAVEAAALLNPSFSEDLWASVRNDCIWIDRQPAQLVIGNMLARNSLWAGRAPKAWQAAWTRFSAQLLQIDPNYSVWIDWYERRIRGERAAFDIPGDNGRFEDKKILRHFAAATDEDFWGKGHEYVNATLKGWIDEARARVAPPPEPDVVELEAVSVGGSVATATLEVIAKLPPQEPGAIAYGVNEQGKLDRLPNADQVHLRDVPDQRQAYDDLREAAAELLDEGQRLGHRLKRALERFVNSLPEHFEDAEAYLVWRDANALRRLHRAHREAAKAPEPDEAKLEPVVAEGLGGLLDLYNNFAFADDGLRAKDEARIAPQERVSAEAEAKAAMPLVEAILANPEIATPEALNDIVADAENAELPFDDPYTDQDLDQANRTRRNWIAALISFGKRVLDEAGKSAKEIRSGAERAVGALVVSEVAGVTTVTQPVIQFIKTYASAIKGYAAAAYSSLPSLTELIDRIAALLT